MSAEADAEHLQLLQLLQDSQSTTYVAIAALTLLVLEHIMTLREEIEHMWLAKWSLAKGLYLWNRYFALAALSFDLYFYTHRTVSDNVCQIFIQVQGLAATIIVGTVDVVFLLRVYVLYGNSKKMLMFLIPLVLCEVIPMVIIPIFSDRPLKHFPRFDGLLGCYTFSVRVPRLLTFYNIPALAASSIMFILTLYKCGFAILNKEIQMPVIRLFARDGIVSFVAVLLITSTNIIIWAMGRPTLAAVNIAMSCAAYSIIASRVLLNIKTTLVRTGGLNHSTSHSGDVELRFAPRSIAGSNITDDYGSNRL